ncbi:MAG: heme ABC transporter ATP-binding protein, partial [Mesorhizobium sp.]
IVGIAGVAGNGQRELSHVLTGLQRIASGRIVVDGAPLGAGDAAAFSELGIGHIPEDRLRSGLAPAMSVAINAVMREYKK